MSENRVLTVTAAIASIGGFIAAFVFSADFRDFVSQQWSSYRYQWLSGLLAAVLIAAVLVALVTALRSRDARRGLERWAAEQSRKLLDSLPAGAYDGGPQQERTLTLADFDTGSLYVPPRFTARPQPSTDDLFAAVVAALDRKTRVIVRAEPGQGKSLFLQLLYVRLLTALQADGRRARVPLLIALDRVDPDHVAATNARATTINACAVEQCDFPRDLLSSVPSVRFAVLLDGLDELRAVGTTPEDTQRILTSAIFAADVITTRETFFELRVSAQVANQAGIQVTLSPLPFDQVGRDYVRNYCRLLGGDAESVINTIEADPGLLAEVSRPLVLFMTTDILANPSNDGTPTRWEKSDIYATYIHKWLRREELRAGSVLTADEKGFAAQRLAWELFARSAGMARAYGNVEVSDLIVDRRMIEAVVAYVRQECSVLALPEAVARDLRERCFLIKPTSYQHTIHVDSQFRFVHKSFFEYLLATYLITQLAHSPADAEPLLEVLREPFPDVVIRFIREMLSHDDVRVHRAVIEANFLTVLDSSQAVLDVRTDGLAARVNERPMSSELEMARQQAGNLVPLVTTVESLPPLIHRAQTERSFFVRRGIAVGLALHHGIVGPLEEFVALMDTSGKGQRALDVHIGYNRIYYGDQQRTDHWLDDGGQECSAFFAKTVSQLDDPERYRPIWAMTVFTLRWLLSSGRFLGETEDVRTLLRSALERCGTIEPRTEALSYQITAFEDVGRAWMDHAEGTLI